MKRGIYLLLLIATIIPIANADTVTESISLNFTKQPVTYVSVPEPESLFLLGIGVVALVISRGKGKK